MMEIWRIDMYAHMLFQTMHHPRGMTSQQPPQHQLSLRPLKLHHIISLLIEFVGKRHKDVRKHELFLQVSMFV